MNNDSLISCPPCRSPERCVGGECAMQLDKVRALLALEGLVLTRRVTKEQLAMMYPPPSQGSNEEKA